jgi:thiol-disulfide isomerase/thioredoxin
MLRVALWACLLVPVSALLAADDSKDYDGLVKEFQGESRSLIKEFQTTEDSAAREKIKGRFFKLQLKFVGRFLELAEKQPKEEASLKALAWIIDNAGNGPNASAPVVANAVNLLRQHHVKNEKIGSLCMSLTSNGLPETEKLLREVIEQNASKDAQGEEAHKKKQAELGDRLTKEAEKQFALVEEKYADVKARRGTLGTLAKDELFVLKNLSIGKMAPDFEGEDGDGKKFKLSDYRGKVVLLDFWGHWCGPCRATYPHNRELAKRLEKKPFALVGVNSDRTLDTIKKAMDKEGNAWRYAFDGGSTSGPIAKTYKVELWPTMYVLDHKGVIRMRSLGSPDEAVLD